MPLYIQSLVGSLMTLATRNIPESVIDLIPESLARENCVIALNCSPTIVTIAYPNDATDWYEQEKIESILGRSIRWVGYPSAEIQSAINRHYELSGGVESCHWKFRYRCPHRWRNFATTEDETVRFCPVCSRNVYLCASESEFNYHAQAGHCVAKIDGFDMELIGEVAIELDGER